MSRYHGTIKLPPAPTLPPSHEAKLYDLEWLLDFGFHIRSTSGEQNRRREILSRTGITPIFGFQWTSRHEEFLRDIEGLASDLNSESHGHLDVSDMSRKIEVFAKLSRARFRQLVTELSQNSLNRTRGVEDDKLEYDEKMRKRMSDVLRQYGYSGTAGCVTAGEYELLVRVALQNEIPSCEISSVDEETPGPGDVASYRDELIDRHRNYELRRYGSGEAMEVRWVARRDKRGELAPIGPTAAAQLAANDIKSQFKPEHSAIERRLKSDPYERARPCSDAEFRSLTAAENYASPVHDGAATASPTVLKILRQKGELTPAQTQKLQARHKELGDLMQDAASMRTGYGKRNRVSRLAGRESRDRPLPKFLRDYVRAGRIADAVRSAASNFVIPEPATT